MPSGRTKRLDHDGGNGPLRGFRAALAIGVLVLSASCTGSLQPEKRPAAKPELLAREADAALADCDQQWRAGALKSRTERATCIAASQIRIYRNYGYPFMDLIVLQNRKRVELARREDAGYPKGPIMSEWRDAVQAVIAEDARRSRILEDALSKPARTEQERLARRRPGYLPPQLAQTRCEWAGSKLSCRVTPAPMTPAK